MTDKISWPEFMKAGYAKLRNCPICGAGYGIRVHPQDAVITINTYCACPGSENKHRVASWNTVRSVVDMGDDT